MQFLLHLFTGSSVSKILDFFCEHVGMDIAQKLRCMLCSRGSIQLYLTCSIIHKYTCFKSWLMGSKDDKNNKILWYDSHCSHQRNWRLRGNHSLWGCSGKRESAMRLRCMPAPLTLLMQSVWFLWCKGGASASPLCFMILSVVSIFLVHEKLLAVLLVRSEVRMTYVAIMVTSLSLSQQQVT